MDQFQDQYPANTWNVIEVRTFKINGVSMIMLKVLLHELEVSIVQPLWRSISVHASVFNLMKTVYKYPKRNLKHTY